MPVPFADLHLQYLSIKPEIDEAVARVIESSAFVRGPFVERFEEEYAEVMEAKHCVSCADGTAALQIAMHALGLRPGDEVITTAHSWISTSAMITRAGGVPVFVDTDPDTYCIDPALIEAKITPRTVGIIPVHLYGQPADLDPIMAVAQARGLWVIEDCAQAHLATYKGKKVGTFGVAATWSFYPGKNLGAMGDAGAITTSDDALAKKAARFARHGGLQKHSHEIEGINSRLDGLQAAILSVKLRHLPEWTRRRQGAAEQYDQLLAGVDGVVTPLVRPGAGHVYHLYVVRSDQRDALAAHLAETGIGTQLNYPVALPFLEAYARFDHQRADFPNAHHNQSRVLSLPMFGEITPQQVEEVCASVTDFSHRQAVG